MIINVSRGVNSTQQWGRDEGSRSRSAPLAHSLLPALASHGAGAIQGLYPVQNFVARKNAVNAILFVLIGHDLALLWMSG